MIKQTILVCVILASINSLLENTSLAQLRPQAGGFKNEADSVYWWKYRRFLDGLEGYTKEEHEILRLMEVKGVRIQLGSKVKVLVRDPLGTVLEQESFIGTVIRKRHQVFYTVRDSLQHDFEYHLFDIELPEEEISKLNHKAGESPKKKDPAKKSKRTRTSH